MMNYHDAVPDIVFLRHRSSGWHGRSMCYNNTIRPETREAPNPRARYDETSERQILWHFEAHDDGDDDDDVRDNDDDDDDGDDDLGESCVFSFARMSKCRLGHTLDVPGAK